MHHCTTRTPQLKTSFAFLTFTASLGQRSGSPIGNFADLRGTGAPGPASISRAREHVQQGSPSHTAFNPLQDSAKATTTSGASGDVKSNSSTSVLTSRLLNLNSTAGPPSPRARNAWVNVADPQHNSSTEHVAFCWRSLARGTFLAALKALARKLSSP